ncbi:hypothetical protein GCM10027418_19190 [Mariniluteicoccus endophyticus]
MTSYVDFYGLTLPPEPATRVEGGPTAPIVTAAVAALLLYVKPDDHATVTRCAVAAPAAYLHGLLEANPGRVPEHVRDLVEAAINVVGPAERVVHSRLKTSGMQGVQFRHRAAALDLDLERAHAAMLQRMGATHTQAAREAAAYSRYVADSLGH